MMFHVGQRVVCISGGDDGDPGWDHPWPSHIVVGGVYTVRGIDAQFLPSVLFLYLEEHLIPPALWAHVQNAEPGFNAEHFRPAVEKKTDISVFTALLAPSGRKLETVMIAGANRVRSPGLESENTIRTGTPA